LTEVAAYGIFRLRAGDTTLVGAKRGIVHEQIKREWASGAAPD
jgi:hypothetical protein